MRVTLYGLESGAVDLLITDTETYRLSGTRDSPDACVAVGRKYTPPAANWLSSQAVCDGEAPLVKTSVQWWKTPAADGRTNWQWYKTDTRLPWRTMFPSRSSDPAVIGDYGMSYFPTFTPLAETNLARLRDFCASKSQSATGAVPAANTARELMAIGTDIGETERANSHKAGGQPSRHRRP